MMTKVAVNIDTKSAKPHAEKHFIMATQDSDAGKMVGTTSSVSKTISASVNKQKRKGDLFHLSIYLDLRLCKQEA